MSLISLNHSYPNEAVESGESPLRSAESPLALWTTRSRRGPPKIATRECVKPAAVRHPATSDQQSPHTPRRVDFPPRSGGLRSERSCCHTDADLAHVCARFDRG